MMPKRPFAVFVIAAALVAGVVAAIAGDWKNAALMAVVVAFSLLDIGRG